MDVTCAVCVCCAYNGTELGNEIIPSNFRVSLFSPYSESPILDWPANGACGMGEGGFFVLC